MAPLAPPLDPLLGLPQDTYTPPGPDGGWITQTTYTPPPDKVPTSPQPGPHRGRGSPMYPPPGQGIYPLPRDRTAHRILDTPRSVCLLRSRKYASTFSFRCIRWNYYHSLRM